MCAGQQIANEVSTFQAKLVHGSMADSFAVYNFGMV